MAARLMEIKSRMLLPNEGDDDEDLLEAEIEDPRWSLVKQLLEFRETKERAQLLEAAHRSRSQCFERVSGDLPPPEPGSLDLTEASIRERLLECGGNRSPFSQIFPHDLGLRGLISYFMALLELTRLRHLRLEQPDDFGDILVILREVA